MNCELDVPSPCWLFGVLIRRALCRNLASLNLSGTIPASLGHLRMLQSYGSGLVLADNRLTGTIPSELHALTSAAVMDLSNNRLTGSVALPCWVFDRLAYQIALTSFDVSHNELSGFSFEQAEFCVFEYSLRSAWFGHNRLTGTLPSVIGYFTALVNLDASHNMYTGTLPSALTQLTQLQYLDVSSNQLTGELPVGIGSLALLSKFDVSDNLFDPVLPLSMCSLPTSMSYCNITMSQQWKCDALSCTCARRLVTMCGVGPTCLQTCQVLPSDLFYAAVIGSLVVVIVGTSLATYYIVKRRKRMEQLSKGREVTLQLLKPYIADDDLANLLLPCGSVDFGPESPCVATGGGGRVFQCHAVSSINERTKLKQTVALKEIYSMMDLVASAQGIEEFAKELVILMQLRHENIVSFLGVYFHLEIRDGSPYERYFMVTEFAANGSLDMHVCKDFTDGPSARMRFKWVREIALAINYLHRESFVHRDIKLQNVLIDADWKCLVCAPTHAGCA